MPERLLPAWEAFHTQAERVEAARRGLLSCLPVGRVDPAPVPVGLELLRDELTDVAAQLHRWRTEEVADTWRGCREAVAESLRAVDHAHRTATTTTELEEVLGAVGAVVEPLDAWADAERRWLRLRR